MQVVRIIVMYYIFLLTLTGPLDQQEIDRRNDVIVFETAKATEPLHLTGALNAHLFLSSDAIDTDFMVPIRYEI